MYIFSTEYFCDNIEQDLEHEYDSVVGNTVAYIYGVAGNEVPPYDWALFNSSWDIVDSNYTPLDL